ncbi:hypothetical protein F2Q69_00006449 [Brassica cretica]|uniref:Uncharacterized protein n=1 Tax=Brassica cretica TaxID=69181 RepID=A0A8S9P2L0_BRACR|nr:hypothetical protein F2Q69_00006449 [Brassica cretica]
MDPEFLGNPEYLFSQGPYSAFLGKNITGTCLDFAFCRSEAGHYREPEGSSLDPEIFDWNPEAIGEPGGTVLLLPRQDYYWYLFGFRILPLGSWPLSSSYAVFYFYKKSLTGLEGAGVGVMTQVPGFTAFHIWRRKILNAPWRSSSWVVFTFAIMQHNPVPLLEVHGSAFLVVRPGDVLLVGPVS